ncbi:MAG: peptide chain release factor N(5)-glutamine methyltransferase [Bacteroidales bacterium]|nr:peptide chain release factor N(5)-glutamine methyltransferase [Bacteroidales bacterium]
MKQEKLTINSARVFLRHQLASYYPGKELNAIIKIILNHISGKDRTFILANPGHEISSFNWIKVNKICDDLKNMKPVQYITGQTDFYGSVFEVAAATLIPRQETEELVDLVIKDIKKTSPAILDIGTGTGCIAISLALNIEGALVTATDSSEGALSVATANADRHEVAVNFIHDDILHPDIKKYGQYDLVVSNPPYITESEKTGMGKNVVLWEPHDALFVPDDNALIYYRHILELNRKVLKSCGKVFFEINENKAEELKNMLVKYGYKDIGIINDIHGKNRIIKGIKR